MGLPGFGGVLWGWYNIAFRGFGVDEFSGGVFLILWFSV